MQEKTKQKSLNAAHALYHQSKSSHKTTNIKKIRGPEEIPEYKIQSSCLHLHGMKNKMHSLQSSA